MNKRDITFQFVNFPTLKDQKESKKVTDIWILSKSRKSRWNLYPGPLEQFTKPLMWHYEQDIRKKKLNHQVHSSTNIGWIHR